jgi:iron-sulfur cluster assembly protein
MITITEKAAEKVKSLLAGHQEYGDPGLRVSVSGGGCSGYQYKLAIEDGCTDEDKVIEAFGARLFVDRKSEFYLDSMVIDYEEGVMSSGFKFHNPKASRTCKCGDSFAV